MNLLETLKQFKNIHPDATFSETSKRAILATMPAAAPWSARRVLFAILETGVAVTLTGFFILLVMGGLSGSKLAPVQYSAIDPQGLRAEAQAIDIQIQLANLNYSESSPESTVAITGSAVKTGASIKPSLPEAGTTGGATTTTTSTLTIDQALQKLSN